MDPDSNKDGAHYSYVSGFGSLASFMASDSDHSPYVYRRFDKLAARDIIYYQSQLVQLEAEQDELDIQDRIDVDSTECGGEEHRNMIRDCVQNWTQFEQAAMSGTPSIHGPADGRHSETWKKRMDLAMRIRATLKDYREALIQVSTLLSTPTPSPQTMSAMSRYFHGSTQLPTSRFTGQAPYSLLSGTSASLYSPMSASQIRASDYISLSKPADPDLLTNLLRTRLSWLFRIRPSPSPTLPLYNSERPQGTISHLHPNPMKYYSYPRVMLTASVITTLAAATLLFIPIFTLYQTSQMQPSLTLGLIAMFTIVFGGSLAVMTTASRSEIFGACAAYSAVLVVFVSGDFASGKGNG